MLCRALDFVLFFELPKRWKMDVRSGAFNGTVSRKLVKYKLDLLGMQNVIWVNGGTELANDCTLFYGCWSLLKRLAFSYIR
jgi:hypothetical protein